MIILLKVNNLERMLDTKSRGLQCVQDNILILLSFQMVIMPQVLVVCNCFKIYLLLYSKNLLCGTHNNRV